MGIGAGRRDGGSWLKDGGSWLRDGVSWIVSTYQLPKRTTRSGAAESETRPHCANLSCIYDARQAMNAGELILVYATTRGRLNSKYPPGQRPKTGGVDELTLDPRRRLGRRLEG